MRNPNKKAIFMVPFGAVAGLLAIASVAYACTSWIGQFQVTGNNTPSDTVTSDGKGTRTSFTMSQCVTGPVTKSTKNSGSITIWTGTSPQDANCNNSSNAADRRLPECGSGGSGDLTCTGTNKRVYNVNFYNSKYPTRPGYTDHTTWNEDCMSGLTSQGVVELGEVTVDSNGNIDSATVGANGGSGYDSTNRTANFNLPGSLTADRSPKESAVCVSDNAAYYGNQAPLTVV